jgi:hypothetical protein
MLPIYLIIYKVPQIQQGVLAIFEQPPEKVKQDKIFENVGYF